MPKARQQYYADNTSLRKRAREFGVIPELLDKIESADENVIEIVKVNGVPLVPDENKAVDVPVPLVEDSLTSFSDEDALSANQGRILYDYISRLMSIGRFLSSWNAGTGLPASQLPSDPYIYNVGDYYIVSAVSSGTNYKPDGGVYVEGTASQVVETESLGISDIYIYDGNEWLLIPNSGRVIAIDSQLDITSQNAVENRVITDALNHKQNILTAGTNITISGDTISATDTKYTAGTGISIDANNVISATGGGGGGGVWGQITGTLSDQTDLQNALNGKQNTLTAGTGISIDANNVISATGGSSDFVVMDFDGSDEEAEDIMNYVNDHPDKMVVVRYNDGYQERLYYLAYTDGALEQDNNYYVYFFRNDLEGGQYSSYNTLYQYGLTFYGWNGAYSSRWSNSRGGSFISPEVNYNSPYMPSKPGHPATKKYVDERVNTVYENIQAGSNITIDTECVINNDKRGPCPMGFHVPDVNEIQNLFSALGRNGLDISALKMPLSGVLDYTDGTPYDQGTYGYYATNYAQSGGRTRVIMSAVGSAYYNYTYMNRANGFPIRPFRDELVNPDGTWTLLEDFSSTYGAGAGIYWNEDDELITFLIEPGYSGSYYNFTIADKNLGATVVYNYGDTLDQTNCGNYYQWGNNYGFPYAGAVDISSTQVDASAYGPGNYYSDDTFITGSSDWSNPSNNNLWGYTTASTSTDCSMTISAQVPDSAAWGNISGDIANQTDLAYALLGKADVADVNTKTFYLSSTSDLTTAQAAYDWYVAGKNPVIAYNKYGLQTYLCDGLNGDVLMFRSPRTWQTTESNSSTVLCQYTIYVYTSNGEVYDIGDITNYPLTYPYLVTNEDYSTPYVPQYDGSPATKKYVDDSVNTKTFYLTGTTGTSNIETAQAIYDWRSAGKNPIISYTGYQRGIYIFETENNGGDYLYFKNITPDIGSNVLKGIKKWVMGIISSGGVVSAIDITEYDNRFLSTDNTISYTPSGDYNPATKKYVDDNVVRYIAGNNITIDANNVISTTLGNVFIFRGSVSSYSNLPTSGQSVGDVWIASDTGIAWAWDGTQWISLGGMSNLNNYFNKTQDDSDDITQGTTNLFVTQAEKNTWNAKQNALTAGANIQINGNTISATNTTYSGGTGISISGTTISNTGVTSVGGQSGSVSLKTVNGNSLIGSGDVVIAAFAPTTAGTAGQVLTKTANGYDWMSNSSNIKCFQLNMIGYTQAQLQEIISWINTGVDYGAVVKTMNGAEVGDVFLYSNFQSGNDGLEYLFVGTKSYTETYPDNNNSQYTKLGNGLLKIVYNPVSQVYSLTWTRFNDVANFIECAGVRGGQGYDTPFMPTQGWQPATKAYVDSVAGSGGIQNETSGTTYRVTKIWSGTQAQYNSIGTKDANTLYFVF